MSKPVHLFEQTCTKLFFIFPLIGIVFLSAVATNAFGQLTAKSQCVTTKVGSPTGTPPTLPPDCSRSGGGGNYRFPLSSADVVTSISTEMGAYGGTYQFQGHGEHAGLDIGTPIRGKVPVYAITDGEVVEKENANCQSKFAGCRMKIKHSGDNFISVYTHIDYSSIGTSVSQGQQIGVVHWWPEYSGMDHLHFELREQGSNQNINPRNYFPELQRFGVAPGYSGNVRNHSRLRGYPLMEDGKQWAEKFQNHPPCLAAPSTCWAF